MAVPTTAGTGSEVTPYAILTIDWAETKQSIAADSLFPIVAYLDGKYTLSLPWSITANTAVDALTHSIEGFINNKADSLTDLLALESIAIIGKLLRSIVPQQISLTEREELLYASMLGGIVIAHTGTGIIHALGYQLTYFNNLPHGLANGVVTKAVLEFLEQASPIKVKQVVDALGCNNLDEVGALLIRVLPGVSISLTEEEQKKYVTKTLQAKNIANCPKPPKEEDLFKICLAVNSARKQKGKRPVSVPGVTM
nr:iron-containing alcohol dehydrogenase [Desulforamulus aquiferis]